MSVVIDTNALVAFVTNEEAAKTVGGMLRAWSADDTQLHSPMLARHEIIYAFLKPAPTSRDSKAITLRCCSSVPTTNVRDQCPG
ncbi:MAG: hypothetical protein WAU42_08860 [Solirubrobacteraceae bacterium]